VAWKTYVNARESARSDVATSRAARARSRSAVEFGRHASLLRIGPGCLSVVETVDCTAWTTLRAVGDFAGLRRELTESYQYWWPEMGPLGDTKSFEFAHRVGRLGPVAILDTDFRDDVWVDGGELRPHYHVTLPLPGGSAPGDFTIFRPEGKQGDTRYVGRRISVMINRHALEDALGDALGRALSSQIDVDPLLPSGTGVARSWIAMVWLMAKQVFQPDSVLQQPIVWEPFVDSVVRGFLMAAEHPHRAELDGEPPEASPQAVRSAIEAIEAEPQRSWTVSALAAHSYVSVRSLQQAFRDHLDTTPMAYLRGVRLRRARESLLESDPSVETVSSIAFRWGFTNMGRFAAAYAARYGENPAVTRRISNRN
jgi:AraC-like DNA-binding protein